MESAGIGNRARYCSRSMAHGTPGPDPGLAGRLEHLGLHLSHRQSSMRSEAGRSPGSRVAVPLHLPNLPKKISGYSEGTRRLQLRGQPRIWSLMGTPHRVPF